MSVTDGTSSRSLARPPASADRSAIPGAFDRLKRLAALLLRAQTVVVLLDDEDGAPGDGSCCCGGGGGDSASPEIEALAHHVRKRGPGGTFIADAASQSWLTDARLLMTLGGACGGVPITLADGSICGCVCVLCGEAREWMRDEEDILRGIAAEVASRVELRRAERAERFRAAEAIGRMELLDTILATSADHLFVFDRNARYTYVGRAGAQAVGKSPADMIGRTLAEVGFPPEVAEPIEHHLKEAKTSAERAAVVKDQFLAALSHELRTPLTPVLVTASALSADETLVRDITGRKAIEHHLKEAKTSAERAAVVKDQFLAALSHELRTPLTPVLVTASALSVDETLPPNVRGAVEMIRRNVELQTRLIDDLLDLTRVARGKITLKLDAIDLVAAVHEAAEMCACDASAKGVHVTLPPRDSGPPCYVRGDGARVRQVLWNLVKNAVKFTPADGEVSVTIQPDAGDGRVALAVKDTGIGIPAYLIERIFLPFEQGDPALSRRYGGLGLGLAISKALVELHGGNISARSAGLNRGATFTLQLPSSPPPPPAPPVETPATASETAKPFRTLRILLVDDHEDTRYVLRRLLAEHDVRTATCVSEALEEAALYDFDLLLSDIGLPDGSGLDLMQQLRARYNMKGIALSGYGTEDDVRRSLAAGFSAHATKPITAEALYGVVANVASLISSPRTGAQG